MLLVEVGGTPAQPQLCPCPLKLGPQAAVSVVMLLLRGGSDDPASNLMQEPVVNSTVTVPFCQISREVALSQAEIGAVAFEASLSLWQLLQDCPPSTIPNSQRAM